MPLERNDVRYPLWRKKVDGSLLRDAVTPIPAWVAQSWSIPMIFPGKGGRRDPNSRAELVFLGQRYGGAVTSYDRQNSVAAYRLIVPHGVVYES